MSTFINIDLEKPIELKFLAKHILFSIIWIIGIAIIAFRIDLTFKGLLSENTIWIARLIPFFYFIIVLTVVFASKWYYSIAFLFYPLLLFFWFIPKQVLAKGKIYLFSNYVNSVIRFFKTFKSSIIQFFIFVLTLFSLVISDSVIIRIISIIVFAFFYYRYVFSYIKKSFSPPRLFGTDIDKVIEDIISTPEKGSFLIKTIEGQKALEKLESIEANNKKLEELIYLSSSILNLKENLSGFNGKRAFLISWIYQLVIFLLITLIFYTFVNFELFIINKSHFSTIGHPSLFDFFYYTIKTITFGNIEIIKPISVFARTIEILSFLTLGIFLFIIVISIFFSLKQDKLSENVKKATDLCVFQNKIIADHIKEKYKTDIQTVINESVKIRNSLENLKKVIQKLF
jgi:hypothetical protein